MLRAVPGLEMVAKNFMGEAEAAGADVGANGVD